MAWFDTWFILPACLSTLLCFLCCPQGFRHEWHLLRLPVRFNDGKDVPEELLGQAVNEIVDQFSA